jgi:hypothetical protein
MEGWDGSEVSSGKPRGLGLNGEEGIARASTVPC